MSGVIHLQVKQYDCPRCDRHHEIPFHELGLFLCCCGLSWASKQCGIVDGKYRVYFVGGRTRIQWHEKKMVREYDPSATIEKMDEIYGENWEKNLTTCMINHHRMYRDRERDDPQEIVINHLRYKITEGEIERMLLLR